MCQRGQQRSLILRTGSRATVFALAFVFVLIAVATEPVQARTFKVIYSFSGGQDGATPYAGLTMVTTTAGGAHGYGVVWEITQ